MNDMCTLVRFGKAKFDESGRQKALYRLGVLDTVSEPAFERIVDLVKTTLGVPICAVSLVDHDRQWFKAFRGLGCNQTPRDIAFCDHAIRADAPFVIEDSRKDPRFAKNPLVTSEPFIRSYLGVPLKMPDGYIIGTLCAMDRKPRVFSDHEIAILENFCKLVAVELELRTVASTDGLTNLLSREAWSSRVQEEIQKTSRHNQELSIIFIDLDHFKKVNDQWGHDVGDLVLRKTSSIIDQSLRKHDLIGRLGGEEFSICLIGANRDSAILVAERIRRKLEDVSFPEYPGLNPTVSVGVASFVAGDDLASLLKRSDNALYEAKENGRNRVVAH